MKTTKEQTTTKRSRTTAPQAANVAPETATATTGASPKKKAAKAPHAAKEAKASKHTKPATEPRADSKKSIILNLLQRPKGATLGEIMTATDWMAHSVRGFISGHIGKKLGIAVESTMNAEGERTYRIAK
jgi:hypothetical protein